MSERKSRFIFDVKTRGEYYLRIEGSGYFLPGSVKVQIPCTGECKFVKEEGVLTVKYAGMDDPKLYTYKWELDDISKLGRESINLVPEEDLSYIKGIEESDEPTQIDSSSASHALNIIYNVKLLGWWGFEYTQQLLNVFESLSFMKNPTQKVQKEKENVTKWKLVDERILNDVKQASESDDGETIIISKDAFRYSRKSAVEALPEKKAFYFSKRLNKAVIRVLCLHSESNMKELFKTKHNIELLDPVYHQREIKQLSGYDSNNYQRWFKHPEELLELASTWEEYPLGFQSVKGLKYLLRRKDGLKHPVYPAAPAVAWPNPGKDSFIEFMESGFNFYFDIPKLVLHEIAHFIHKTEVSKKLQDEWLTLAAWRRDPNDPDGWTTDQQTEFVTSYGHGKTPMEDFAEAITYYILSPRKLNSRAPKKYQWIMDNVMEGQRYVTMKSHTFEVLNKANPDYDYPGRVVQVVVKVHGGSDEEKKGEIEVTLHAVNEAQDCAVQIRTRLYSDLGTYVDLVLRSPNGQRCSHKLTVKFNILPSWRRGVWTTDQLSISDDFGNMRYVGISGFGLRLWINNAGEDFTPPQLVPGSLSMKLFTGRDVEKFTPLAKSHPAIQVLRVTLLTKEDSKLKFTTCKIGLDEGDQYSIFTDTSREHPEYTGIDTQSFRLEAWEGYRKVPIEQCIARASESEKRGWKCYQVAVNTLLPEYKHTGTYRLRYLYIDDSAKNSRRIQYPSDDTAENAFVRTSHPDYATPKLRNVRVSSTPANNLANGETHVKMSVEAMDDYSGINHITYEIIDPHGALVRDYLAILQTQSPYFEGDPTQWREYKKTHTLPPGSIPGVWALRKIEMYDNAGNRLTHMLTEQIHIVNNNA